VDDPAHPDPKVNDVRAMLFDGDNLWIGTNAGVVLWHTGTPWAERRRLNGPVGRINSIDMDRGGGIWIGTRTEGLQRWDAATQRFQAYVHHAEDTRSLPSNAINAAMEDRGGTLWVASFTDGVSRANMGNYGFERIIPREVAPDSFPSSNFVRSVGPAPQGQIWLGVDDGLALFDPASHHLIRKYTANGQPGSLSHNSVYALYQQPDGPLWVGTSKGLNRFDAATGRFTMVPYDSPSEGFINTVAPGRHGTLWVGTAGSLQHLDLATGHMDKYHHDPADPGSRSQDDTSTVLEDSQGRVWVGDFFRGGGLDLLDQHSGKFRHFRHDERQPDSLGNDKVTCVYEDMYGTIWIGTARGLNRLVPDRDGQPRFRAYVGEGTPGPVMIESIQSDQTGILWIGTAKGLSRFDPSSGVFIQYSADDGLTDGLYLGSSARSSDGKLYFGSSTGITAVYPALPFRAPTPPQVAITDIRLSEKSLTGGLPPKVRLEGSVIAPRSLTLPASASVLTLEFAALHYAAPRRNQYSYKLEGFDEEWVSADASHPMATYTNLYPGEYRFLVRATSNKGLHSPVIELPITITPPYWQTWWFRIAAVLVLFAAGVLAYRSRVKGLKRRARRLEVLVAQRTAELEESNRKLSAMASTDGLTGLANRRSFDEVLAREWARARRKREPLALAMIDVDHFKPYNDHYGHQAGDDCLRQVAAVLAHAVRRGTDLAARYGGEEFAFIAPATSTESALAIAEQLRADIEELRLPHEKSPLGHVTVSIGVAAIVPDDGQDTDLLIRSADQALYRAKTQGRNLAMLGYSAAPRDNVIKIVQ
jgi:diguanylate cyclase (GGDEF)-like protein